VARRNRSLEKGIHMTQNSGRHFFLMHDFLEHCAQVLGMLVISGLLLIQVMQDVLGSQKKHRIVFCQPPLQKPTAIQSSRFPQSNSF